MKRLVASIAIMVLTMVFTNDVHAQTPRHPKPRHNVRHHHPKPPRHFKPRHRHRHPGHKVAFVHPYLRKEMVI